MSYREENGQAILTMPMEDYEHLLKALSALAVSAYARDGVRGESLSRELAFLNRLNEGNPRYTPYRIPSSSPVTPTEQK